MSTGYPDGQKITQWIGAPIAQAVAAAIGAGPIVIGPTRLSSWASVIVALKPTGGQVTITVTQTVPNGPAGLVLSQQVVVPDGATVFESFVLFGADVTITLQGAVGGTTVDYAVTPSNTTTNAQVLTNATINVQHNGVLVAAEPTLDFVDAGVLAALTDDGPNTRVKVQMGLPAGTILAYGGAAAPAGYLLCDGSAVSRATFAALFTAIGVVYGAGDGSTTFNLPDLRGRSIVGKGTNGTVSALAQSDGVAVASRRGTLHRHTTHAHGQSVDSVAVQAGAGAFGVPAAVVNGAPLTSSVDGGSGVGTDPLDGGAYLVVNHIIAT